MFRSRKKSRRRDRSNRAHSHRLGVELMEGRMMLSGTGIAPAQPTLDLTQISLVPAQFSLTGDRIKLSEQPTDGGYVNAFFASGLPLAYDANIVSADAVLTFGGHGTSVAINLGSNSFTSGVTFDRADSYSNTATFHEQSNSLIDSGGLIGKQIDVTPAWPSSDDSPVINLQPVVVGPNPSTPVVSDGGAIPIHAIFVDFRKDSHLASGVKAISSPAETSVGSLASARREPAAVNAIAGEWARAMVFEIAGGEPAASDSHASDETLQHSEPLSSVETSQQSAKLASRHDVGLPNEGSAAGEQGQPQAAQSNGQIATFLARIVEGGKLAASSSAPAGVEQFSADNPLDAESPNAKALAAAFDQLGEAAVIESTFDGKSWLRSIATSPLLMVLALERIAALNSRRANRESRIAAAKKPLRLRR